MKNVDKLFTGIFALALALTSCTTEKESVADSSSAIGGVIGFSSYATLAKGTPIAGNSNFTDGTNDFGVTAFVATDTSEPYMGTASEGAHIIYSTAWDYESSSDSRYWPSGDDETLNFYAYSPHDGTNRGGTLAVTNDDLTVSAYSVPTTITSQEDFMYASETDVTSSSSSVSNGELTLVFNHALTQINFEVSTAQTNLYAEIESIAIGNVNSSGNFSIASGWSGQDTLATYYASISSGDVIGSTAVDLTSTQDDILMLMPQTFSAWNGTDDVTDSDTSGEGAFILLSCKLYNQTGDAKVYHIGSADSYALTALPLSSETNSDYEWTAGRSITYSIVFASDSSSSGGGGYDPTGGEDDPTQMIYPITFSSSVNGWVSSSSTLNM